MTSTYEDIYKKFLGLIESYDLMELTEYEVNEFMDEWMEAVFSRPKVRKLYNSITFDKDLQQVDYELKNSIDEQYDKNFTEFLCANGMVIGWLTPIANNNELLINQFFGTKESNYFSQANHITAVKAILKEAKTALDKDYVRDHSYGYFALNGSLS